MSVDDTGDNNTAPPEPTDRKLRNDAAKAERNPEQERNALRCKVRVLYDYQELRIQAASRTNKPDKVKVDLHEIDKHMLEHRANEMRKIEHACELDLKAHLKTIPAYNQILARRPDYLGIGTKLSGVILSEFDIHIADTVSKMWSFAGLIAVDAFFCTKCGSRIRTEMKGTAPKKGEEDTRIPVPGKHYATNLVGLSNPGLVKKVKKCQFSGKQVPEEFVRKGKGSVKPTKGVKLPYNSWLRAKLIGVAGPCLLKANSPWRSFYDDYKHRKQSQNWGVSDGHRHNASIRYMIKMMLQQIHREWRELEGLEVRPSYQEEYLGHRHAS